MTLIRFFVAVVTAVPDVIWSGVIGALLAFGGVLLSNRSSSERLRIQLQHDAEERSKERTTAWRREVYLQMVEELVKITSHLTSFPTLDLRSTNFADGFNGFYSAAARLQLIGEPATILLVNELADAYGGLSTELIAKALPAQFAKSDVELADRFYANEQAELSRILADMARLRESGRYDPAASEALEASFKFHQGQSDTYAAQRAEAWSRQSAASVEYQRCLLSAGKDLPSQSPVLVALRRDLGLAGDLSELDARARKRMEIATARFEELMQKLTDAEQSHDNMH